jgi:hypothetical protein
MKAPAPMPVQVKKKEKKQMKHQAFLERLQSPQSPYSRSHNRRLKRKEKQQLVAKMDDLNAALNALQSGSLETSKAIPGVTTPRRDENITGVTSDVGYIGKGKGATLSANQRKRVLYVLNEFVSINELKCCALEKLRRAECPLFKLRKHTQRALSNSLGSMRRLR